MMLKNYAHSQQLQWEGLDFLVGGPITDKGAESMSLSSAALWLKMTSASAGL